MTNPLWFELDIEAAGDRIRIAARGCRGERPAAHNLAARLTLDTLSALATKVGRTARAARALELDLVNEMQSLHEEVLQGEIRDVFMQLLEAARCAKEPRLLVRLFADDRTLKGVPWEALCKASTTEGFWGTDSKIIFARGANSPEPWQPRDVDGAVRILAIAPGNEQQALTNLQQALAPAIEAGEVEWLDPIAGPDVSPQFLYDRLRRGVSPHIVHFIGHGGIHSSGKPTLRLADDEDGEEVWIPVEALARELSASFAETLSLVVLEACEGAKSGLLGNAAEILVKAGADAVVAHLWPIKADIAHTCSKEFYQALTAAEQTSGDVGASMSAARHTLLAHGAQAFSPVLYLRCPQSVIFEFDQRRIVPPGSKRTQKLIPTALQALLEKPFTLVLGDLDADRLAFRKDLQVFMQENGDAADEQASLSALTQRCVMRFGQEVLQSLFQQSLSAGLTEQPPLPIEALAEHIGPGVHFTLLWRPHLERAIAAKHPDRNIFAIQPSNAGEINKPRIVKRLAGSNVWKMEPILPKRFDVDNDIIVLRLYGGYSPEPRPIFSPPVLTEDDHIHGLLGVEGSLRPATWLEELLSRPRIYPGLYVGLSVLDFRHRMLLRWIYDRRPAPQGSVAILDPASDVREPEIWDSGGGLPGAGRIAPIRESPEQLADFLHAMTPAGGRR